MRHLCIWAQMVVTVMLVTACQPHKSLEQQAAELCRYIPDHELLPEAKDYMTEEFYNLLDTMFNRLPEHDTMDNEWLYYFVTGNGGTIADYEVKGVQCMDDSNAVATILVRQKWQDGSFADGSDVDEHKLYMRKVNGKWLIDDFDEHKADCVNYLATEKSKN